MANASGTFGHPPANAPYEVASGVPGFSADQLAMMQANEKVLPPFNPQPMRTAGQVLAAKNAEAARVVVDTGLTIILVEPDVEVEAVKSVDAKWAGGLSDSDAPLLPQQPHQPAASDGDSPSRGIPRPQPKGKEITGGWGDFGEASYFPLDGSEVGHLIIAKLRELEDRITNDLRFSLAVTYPRMNAKVEITVECYANDQTFQIVKVLPPHKATPLETARKHADECCFVVIAEHVEMTPEGESVTPPNQVRIDLGLDVPRKRSIETPSGRRMFVDVGA